MENENVIPKSPNQEVSKSIKGQEEENVDSTDKNKIAMRCGYVGGVIFLILNIATKGKVPGGFAGGVVGFLIGYGIAWLILTLVRKNN